MLPELINMAVTSRVAIKRIKSFLISEELDPSAVFVDSSNR